MITIMINVKWYFIFILVCISLIISDAFFMRVLTTYMSFFAKMSILDLLIFDKIFKIELYELFVYFGP